MSKIINKTTPEKYTEEMWVETLIWRRSRQILTRSPKFLNLNNRTRSKMDKELFVREPKFLGEKTGQWPTIGEPETRGLQKDKGEGRDESVRGRSEEMGGKLSQTKKGGVSYAAKLLRKRSKEKSKKGPEMAVARRKRRKSFLIKEEGAMAER